MANYQSLKAAINAVIKANGNKEITGTVLNEVLLAMVNSLGAGYQFAGVATPSTNPGTPDQKVFYIASQAGTYTNFNGAVVSDGIAIFEWNGTWTTETLDLSMAGQVQSDWTETDTTKKSYIKHKPNIPPSANVDPVPTNGSPNAVASGGVYNALKAITDFLNNGYYFVGIAGTSTVPDSVTQYGIFYIASDGGTYTNFLNGDDEPLTLYQGLNILYKNVEDDGWNYFEVFKFSDFVDTTQQQSLNAGQQTQAQNNMMGKVYAPAQNSGLGKVYLDKNNGVLTQAMMPIATQEGEEDPGRNTVYVIQYDYTLNGNITVPAGCTLEFDGGSISGNYTLTGNNTDIVANPSDIIFSGIDIQGTWIVKDIYVTWMNIPTPLDCRIPVQSICRLQNDNVVQNIYLPNYNLAFTPSSEQNIYNSPLIVLKSNSHLHLINQISVNSNALRQYFVIAAFNKKNIIIDGSGTLYGDVETHDYSAGGSFENGIGVALYVCSDVYIKDIKTNYFTGDGLYIEDSKNCKIDSVISEYNGRQGMSVISCDSLIIKNSIFSNTGNLSAAPNGPGAGIDFETNLSTQYIKNVIVNNCIFKNNTSSILVEPPVDGGRIPENICIINTILGDCPTEQNNSSNKKNIQYYSDGLTIRAKVAGLKIQNCDIHHINGIKESLSTVQKDDIYFNDCRIYGILLYEYDTDSASIHKYHFNNCIFDGSKINITGGISSMFYLNFLFDLYFKNCEIIGADWYNHNSYQSVAEFDSCTCNTLPRQVSLVQNCTITSLFATYGDCEILYSHILGVGIESLKNTSVVKVLKCVIDRDNKPIYSVIDSSWPCNISVKDNIFNDNINLADEKTYLESKMNSVNWQGNI